MIAQLLTERIAEVCPIDGVSIGRRSDKTTWRIDFADHATAAQRAAAEALVDAFDPEVEVATTKKLEEINAAFEAAAVVITSGYPDSEKLTWHIQEREAEAWRSHGAAPTPYIDALAAARGIARVDYIGRVLVKVDEFRSASALLVGTRKKYEDQVRAAEELRDAEGIDAVKPVFSLR